MAKDKAVTAKQAVAREVKEDGYCRWDDPEPGTKYGRWYAEKTKSPYFGTNGIAFCAMGQAYIFAGLGQTAPGMPTASCGVVREAAIKQGRKVSKASAKPGDLVLFRWDGKVNDFSYSDHIGMVIVNYPGRSAMQTFEFNTTINGRSGSVGYRTRGYGVIQMVIRPKYKDGSGTSVLPGKLEVDGLWGTATTLMAQEQAGTPADGIVSSQEKGWKKYYKGCTNGWEWVSDPQGSQLIEQIQITLRDKYGLDVGEIDGIAGRKFWQAMELAAGYDADDKGFEYPSNTVKWFQEQLNAGTFF